MKLLDGLLKSNGTTSTMRLSVLVCIGTACYLAVTATVQAMASGQDVPPGVISMVTRLLVAGILGKSAQKYFETLPSGG